MKPLRLLLKSSSIAMLCMLSFSCVDEAYDISKVKDITLLKNGVDLPIGTFETSMDSILKTVDLKVKNGVYTFLVGNAIDLSAVNSALSGFTPASIPNPAATVVNMLDGTSLPYVPSNIPEGSTNYAGSTSVTLPSFKTTMIDPVDSILLSNTTFTMKAITNNLGGSGLNNSILITCSPAGNVAEYYDPTTGNKITSWIIPINNNAGKTIGIRMLKPTSSNLQINCAAALNVVNGSPVTITAKAMTSISVTVGFSAVDFQTVYGKVDYGKSDNVDIDFGGFGDIITNNSVISFYDPTLKLYTNSNLGVPINLTLNMSSKNLATGITSDTVVANRTMLAASNPTSTKQNVLTIDEPNDGLAGLFKVNPDQISMGYSIQTNKTISSFINKNTFLTISDTMEIPLRFANDLVINKQIEMESPFKKLMDSLPTQDSLQIGFVLTVTNRIPLAIRIKMIGLDDNGNEQFTVTSGLIRAGDLIDSNGFATDTATTTTELLFDNDQINLLKSTPKFKVEFAISATQASGGAALRPSDYIKIKVAGKIRGGIKIDLGDNASN